VLRYFLGLGTWGFGGPIATVGYTHRDLVERRRWLDRQDFLDGVALGQTMPGPLAAQVAMWVGFLHGIEVLPQAWRWDGPQGDPPVVGCRRTAPPPGRWSRRPRRRVAQPFHTLRFGPSRRGFGHESHSECGASGALPCAERRKPMARLRRLLLTLAIAALLVLGTAGAALAGVAFNGID
jgi:hypothetical protein